MKKTREMEPPTARRVAAAANEEFDALLSAASDQARADSGWDPYEVWVRRVKLPAQLKRDRARVSDSGQ